jgi:hypothetical protein
MRNSRIQQAGQDIASGLINTEAAIDRAMAHVSKLITATIEMGSAARLPGGETMPVMEHFADLTRCLVTARGLVTRGHELCADKRETLPVVHAALFGDTFPCPEGGAAGDVVPLALVAG